MKDNTKNSVIDCLNVNIKILRGMKFIPVRPRLIIYMISVFLIILSQGCTTEPARKDSGFDEPPDPEVMDTKTWEGVSHGLYGSFGSNNKRYERSKLPDIEINNNLELIGWKGEVLSAQILLWSKSPIIEVVPVVEDFMDETGRIVNNDFIQIRPVRYVITDEFLSGCGYRDADTIPSHLAADILDTLLIFNIPANSVRPMWVTISIPREIRTGVYSGVIKVVTSSGSSLQFNLTIKVQDWTLPDPAEWTFHLDLWQNPYAVARYYKVEPWSQEHLEFMRPLLTMLSQAGQKCITTSIVDKPWGGQTYDPFQSMITWIKNSDGRWEFDYHIFDLYVSFAMDCGIREQINCYSMVPWGNKIMYMDEDSSKFVTIEVIPGTKEYEDFWRPFLYNFRAHLMEMGWLDNTTIALDERGLAEMIEMFRFLNQTAPELKITMAGNFFNEVNDKIHDFSYNWRSINTNSINVAEIRRNNGQLTTYYVACSVPYPNNFTFSSPAESTFEGWFAAAMGFDGFLRWAYNSWVENPLKDSRFRTWPAGDTYLVYPGPRSSIRFEKLREGIQDYEKIKILESAFQNSEAPQILSKLEELKSCLENIVTSYDDKTKGIPAISKGKQLIREISDL